MQHYITRGIASLTALLLLTACVAPWIAVEAPVDSQSQPPQTAGPAVVLEEMATTTPLPTVTPIDSVAPSPTASIVAASAAPDEATSTPVLQTVTPELTVPENAAPSPTPGLEFEEYARLGDPNAPVTIYEFSDFGCPACRQFALNTFPVLKAEYIDTGLVQLIYKDYPIVSQYGGMAAQAAECSGEQGVYWEMHDLLFNAPEEWNVSPEAALATFGRYGQALGIDADALVECVASERYKADVDRDVEEAMSIGWFGTPTFFINRKMLSGAMPPEVFREVIDRELGGQSGG